MVIKRLLLTLTLFFGLLNIVSAVTTISIVSDYGTKNYLLALYCVLVFIFWTVIHKFTPDFEFDKNNLVTSVTGILSKITCWIWFIGIFYILQGVLMISSNSLFLDGKLTLFYSMIYISILLFSVILVLNTVKLFKKLSGVENFFKELSYEIKTGGRK
jgi:hypothetical protein